MVQLRSNRAKQINIFSKLIKENNNNKIINFSNYTSSSYKTIFESEYTQVTACTLGFFTYGSRKIGLITIVINVKVVNRTNLICEISRINYSSAKPPK